jgi:predicted DCC family thiol-disulfide oxidoreductase YuxK/uncharacterized membrane protein YphA (DoxX/SURF4 family)
LVSRPIPGWTFAGPRPDYPVSQEIRVASPPLKPLLVFDGDCHFCRRWIARWQRDTGDAVSYLPFQDETIFARFPEIPREDFAHYVQLILPDGSVRSGAEAVFCALAEGGRERWLYRFYQKSEGFAEFSELIYEEVARHRSFLSVLDRIYCGPGLEPISYIRTRFVFLRGLALIYLIAFGSLLGQIQGLAGSRGIVPVREQMDAVKTQVQAHHVGLARYYVTPTLAWWNSSDGALDAQCYAGVGLAVLLLFGIAPAPVLFLLWCLYLSLSTVCHPFLDFQWDSLLLETGFLAVLFAPLQWVERPARQSEPSTLALWLLRWLLFRLMLESGCVKLLSGDVSWWNLTALQAHFETQPLPTWIGWHVHQLPAGALAACTVVVFAIELVGPVLIFAGRKMRHTAAWLFVFLQICILLTGNYTFFNWLTILLCVLLLDDDVLRFRRRPSEAPVPSGVSVRRTRWPRFVIWPATLVIGLVTLIGLLGTLRIPQKWPAPVLALYAWLEPLRSFNNYGLFAAMTQTRREIILEGSNDGQVWLPYEFKYKPGGDLKARPRFIAPYQPRLDWQMWFAALSGPKKNPWFLSFETRLLFNSPAVLSLMGRNPFPKAPPKYIRAQLYEYHFTDRAVRRATGQWWRREYEGVYFPPISITPAGPQRKPGGKTAGLENPGTEKLRLPVEPACENFHAVSMNHF